MSGIWDLIGMALADAVKAERLIADAGARRDLRMDPERMLRDFELRAVRVRL